MPGRVSGRGAPAAVLALVLAACGASGAGGREIAGPPRLERGNLSVTVEPDGALLVRLSPCSRISTRYEVDNQPVSIAEPCGAELGELTVTAPWGRALHAPVVNPVAEPPYARVPAAWDEAPVDPLDPRTWDQARGDWRISSPLLPEPVRWSPSSEEVERLVVAIGLAAGIDSRIGPATAPPDLAPGPLQVGNDELLAGGESVLELTVENRGEGPAYRVVATTRSSLPALQGLQLSFGRIDPGPRLTRRVRVRLAPTVAEPSAMLVVVFGEANGFRPGNVSRRVPIRGVAEGPRLTLTCGPATGEAQVDAGRVVRLRCVVGNSGGRLARAVTVTASLGAVSFSSATAVDVVPRQDATVELPVQVPVGASLDQELVIRVVAADAGATTRATTEARLVVRRPGLCPTGTIDRATYDAKRRALEEARAAGDLTAEELDRYDAELVGCLGE